MASLRGLLTWLRPRGGEGRSSLANPNAAMWASMVAQRSASGIAVTPESAMGLSAVNACVRLISESIGSLPLHVYQRGGRRRASESPLQRVLHDEPNELQSAMVFRETLVANTLVHGNGYAPIIRNAGGEPVELLPVESPQVKVRRGARGLVYDVDLGGQRPLTVDQADMLHVPGLSFNGLIGMSPIQYAAQAIGLGLAAEQYGASFFGNGSTPSGYISLPNRLSREQAEALRASWYAAYGGVSNANKTAVLFENAKFERISIPPEEAQFIETRKFQVSEIARWYRVPPHMIGDLERATFSNIEHQALEFVTHTLRPWLVRIEQEFNRKLFPSRMDGRPNEQFCEFSVEGLLRGDAKSRSEFYNNGRQWGWLSVNDIRRLENLEPVEGGDVYLQPLNMVAAGTQPKPADGGTGAR